jgi:DNA polymerase-3 subunit gamma/tau
MPKEYQVLARAYRPKRFADVVGQEAILQTLKNALATSKTAHAYLFTGSRGVGKTTLARLFAKALNCQAPNDHEPCNQCPSCLEIASGQSLDVIEIDGASNRGIDDIRQINETVGFAPSHGKYKIYIIDEVHMLTKEAFNALLKTLEEPPEKAKFFFATTEPHKVLPTIVSRCQRFDLGRISPSQIQKKLKEIAVDLNRSVEPEALELLSNAADGSLRDAESIFDQILCFASGAISAADVQNVLGLAPQHLLFSLDQAFSEFRLAYAFELVEELFQKGKHFSHFFEQLIEHYRNLTVCKTLGEGALHQSGEVRAKYREAAKVYTQAQCLTILDLLLTAEANFSKSTSPRVTLELVLLQVLRTKNRIPVEVLIRRLSDLEDSLLKAGTHLSLPQEPAIAPPEPVFVPLVAASPQPEPIVSVQLPPEPIASPQPTLLPLEPIELKPVPFNPYQPSAKPSPEPILPPQPVLKESESTLSKHPSHYDTLMRFTAVELEGTFKP